MYLSPEAWSALAAWVGVVLTGIMFWFVIVQTRSMAKSLRVSSLIAIKQSLAQLNETILNHRDLAGRVGDKPGKAIQDMLINHYALIFQLNVHGQLDPGHWEAEIKTITNYSRSNPELLAAVREAIGRGHYSEDFLKFLEGIALAAESPRAN
jgi:hypothetical protein